MAAGGALIRMTATTSVRLALDLAGLVAWGEALGRAARAPLVVALSGELGAGKTTLAQAICRGYGVTQPVTSPTFALVHEYAATNGVVLHLDLYRLEDEWALDSIGLDELLARDALVIVEWPERASARLPASARWLRLSVADDPTRRELCEGRA